MWVFFKRLLLAWTLALIAAATGVAAISWKSISPGKAERICRGFIEKRLMTGDGGVYTSVRVKNWFFLQFYDLEELKLSGLLSESTGLLMKYAVAADDRALFDSQFSFARKHLVGQLGLFFWKVSENGELTANSTAVVDDLRIVGACIDAYERWKGGKYLKFALDIGWNIQRHEIVHDQLRDYVSWRDWGDRTTAEAVQLSYIDLPVLRKLAGHEESWGPIAQANEKILAGGQMESGLFHEKFDYGSKTYTGTVQNTINQLYCGLFNADLQGGCEKMLYFFKERLKQDGVIYAEYDASTGEPTKFFESTSVYALLSRYARRCGDLELAETLVKRFMANQNRNVVSPLYGSFSDDEIYSFDNLEALLALREYNAAVH